MQYFIFTYIKIYDSNEAKPGQKSKQNCNGHIFRQKAAAKMDENGFQEKKIAPLVYQRGFHWH